MTWLERRLLGWAAKAVLWLLLAPILLTIRLYRLTGRLLGAWMVATRDSLPCPGCGGPVSMIGRWQCGSCKYVFDGFAFAHCAVCGTIPPFIECQTCGVGVKNPVRFP